MSPKSGIGKRSNSSWEQRGRPGLWRGLAARGAPGKTLDRFERRSFLEARDELRHCGRTFAPDDVGSVAERLVGQEGHVRATEHDGYPSALEKVGEAVRVGAVAVVEEIPTRSAFRHC